jgi:protein gp37
MADILSKASISKSAILKVRRFCGGRNQKSKILYGAFLFQAMRRIQQEKAGCLLDGRTWDDMPVVAGKERIGFSLFTCGNHGSK